MPDWVRLAEDRVEIEEPPLAEESSEKEIPLQSLGALQRQYMSIFATEPRRSTRLPD